MEIPQSQEKDRRHDALGGLWVLPDEILCVLPEYLTPRDIARLSCISSVMYILCNEEPLWMHLCLRNSDGLLEYKGSWKETMLHHLNVPDEFVRCCRKPRHFDGFNSPFLYRRWYRCFTNLSSFDIDQGVLERKKNLSIEEFVSKYDGKKPVLLTDLAETWPARSTWTTDKLLQNYGDTPFKISQRSSKKITMKLKDYVAYMKLQHDEDPLYIFDDKFGEVAPGLLKDYSVPDLFQEDFFDILDRDQRPAFRWLIIGPERSGASWHVDPALTSAWNTLLTGRKRWALYPPGRVPLGVTVNVNEEDGDVNIDTPSSLQWWLDFYPLLADEDKPIECTQLPGETIYVPSGWWHCVLNLETTIAVTQNFVNKSNFEYVCLDFAPGYRHKGVCRAGLLAVDDDCSINVERDLSCDVDQVNSPDMTTKEKRRRISQPRKELYEEDNDGNDTNGFLKSSNSANGQEFTYDIKYLSRFLDEDRDHYNFVWSESNCIGQREMRQWLHKLWFAKPEMRDLVWKGASLALNVSKWSACLGAICGFHNLPSPTDDEKLPVGTGSNPVYLIGDKVIKIYVEGGLESSMHSLGTELEFYTLLEKVRSPLRKHIPDVLASGILLHENGSYRTEPWDGKGIPDMIAKYDLPAKNFTEDGFLFGVWSKKQLEIERGEKFSLIVDAASCRKIWPYIITKRCKGNIFAHLRDELTWDDFLNLASFLGSQLHNLHILPLPPLCDKMYSEVKNEMTLVRTSLDGSEKASCGPFVSASTETTFENSSISAEWDLFIKTLIRRRKDVSSRLAKWGSPIPSSLIEKVEEYIPHDIMVLLNIFKDKNDQHKVSKSPTWIHCDIMDDNIHMEPRVPYCLDDNGLDASLTSNGAVNSYNGNIKQRNWNPSYILDFSDLSIGDPLLDLIPIHVDVFRGDSQLLKKLLENYQLPFTRRPSGGALHGAECKYQRLSYRAMCYCILHDENVLGAIFSLQKELRSAKSWEEVEDFVWGELNSYQVVY